MLRIGIVVNVVSLLFFVWSYLFYYHNWEYTLNSYLTLQDDLRKKNRLLKNNILSFKQYNSAVKTIKKIESRLYSNITQIAMAEEVNALAAKSGVSISASTFKLEQREEGIRKSHQEIILNGGYKELRRFLQGLQSLSSLTVPTEIVIQKKTDKSANVTARILLIGYQMQMPIKEVN
jgi:Tfp pilus assembly protein PilO